MARRFPTAFRICVEHGIDPTVEPIPVAPVQHFMCGGIRTDRHGATDVRGLYAIGECAATGVHGANRLASNSLLEGLVFGARAAEALVAALPEPAAGASTGVPTPVVADSAISAIRSTMSKYAGVRRSAAGLAAAEAALQGLAQPGGDVSWTADAANRWTVASAIVAAATARRESRGCHWRSDHPDASDSWRYRIVVRLDATGVPLADRELVLGRSA
jgi:L-aspartate oxidase